MGSKMVYSILVQSLFMYLETNMTPEEQVAWDMYFAKGMDAAMVCFKGISPIGVAIVSSAALLADTMLEERRKRFAKPE